LTADWIYPITKSTTLLSQGRWVLDHARDVQTPMLIMYGDQDELIDRSACDHLQMRSGSPRSWSAGRREGTTCFMIAMLSR
jgi:hypothetical protein